MPNSIAVTIIESTDATPMTYHREQNAWEAQIQHQTIGSHEFIKEILTSGSMCLVSDGSWKTPYATGAFILAGAELMNTQCIVGSTRCTGPLPIQDSYRAELFGILAGLIQLNRVLREWNLRTTPLKM
jgi:hypothetical protein